MQQRTPARLVVSMKTFKPLIIPSNICANTIAMAVVTAETKTKKPFGSIGDLVHNGVTL